MTGSVELLGEAVVWLGEAEERLGEADIECERDGDIDGDFDGVFVRVLVGHGFGLCQRSSGWTDVVGVSAAGAPLLADQAARAPGPTMIAAAQPAAASENLRTARDTRPPSIL
ncbi:hypothetical protein [Dactylosporangium darangshiense]|uniref:hypothetical protein n=1 Tax=Dactylosporangium darangshiense TaxID=579108 RepID=UPI0031EE2CE9